MRLQEIKVRVAKLEATRKANRYAGMTYEEIEALAQQKLARLIEHCGSFAAVVAAMEASGEPSLQEGARLMVKRYGHTQSVAT
ncbi:hypothetical protein [Methylobacterium sp. E-046]|uniref:hypothetical protein n=1 Tax=Methylobacterium sp. E-046 TaxID=2836576 RepID=UPI001FBBDC0F|nr:hypothetical protein [Methylobacterium sp. E-046]MCJ2098437.1 hypothetical protein [Methylobacterium sp. E-046]